MDLSPGAGHRGTLPVESQSRIFGSPEKHALAVISGLKACIRSKNAEQGRRIHADAAARGIDSNIFVASTLINMYCKCGNLIDARRVFDAVKSRSVVPWNVMILGYAENGDGALALDFLAAMGLQGFSPDSQTIVAALKACASLVSQEQGREIGGRTVKLATLEKAFAIHSRARGLIKNSFVASSLVDLYAKCGSMEDAERAFEGMDFRDVVSWNALMLGYAENGEEELAMEVLRAMELQGCQANSRSFVAALKASSGLGEKEAGIELDGVIVKVSSIEKGMALHSRAAKIGSDRDKFVASAALDMYVKCGSMADAQRAFDRMASRDVVSWNALILGYAETNDRERSLELLQLMIQDGGCEPNSRTFLAALKACRSSQALDSTKVIHGIAARRGSSEKDGVLANSLVDVYGKCGSLLDAHQVFDSLHSSDSITWTSLLAGYARKGDSQRVFELFRSMRDEAIEPNSATFVCLLTACSHSGAVDRSKQLLQSMLPSHGIRPKIEHYICVIDCLSRAGKLEEALRVAYDMPYVADDVAWMTVLGGACHNGGAAGPGGRAFESAVGLGHGSLAPYALMANILEDQGVR